MHLFCSLHITISQSLGTEFLNHKMQLAILMTAVQNNVILRNSANGNTFEFHFGWSCCWAWGIVRAWVEPATKVEVRLCRQYRPHCYSKRGSEIDQIRWVSTRTAWFSQALEAPRSVRRWYLCQYLLRVHVSSSTIPNQIPKTLMTWTPNIHIHKN